MANEVTVRAGLQIIKDPLSYNAQPASFQADMTGTKGPTPGAIAVTTAGVSVSLAELTTPGFCRLMNLDATNYVSYGIWDGTTFYPLGEILPGETYVLRLARNISQEFGTGTGTTGGAINSLRIKADTATVQVVVEAFEK